MWIMLNYLDVELKSSAKLRPAEVAYRIWYCLYLPILDWTPQIPIFYFYIWDGTTLLRLFHTILPQPDMKLHMTFIEKNICRSTLEKTWRKELEWQEPLSVLHTLHHIWVKGCHCCINGNFQEFLLWTESVTVCTLCRNILHSYSSECNTVILCL